MQRHLSTDMLEAEKPEIILSGTAVSAFFDQETWAGKVADAVKWRPRVDITAFQHGLVEASTREVN